MAPLSIPGWFVKRVSQNQMPTGAECSYQIAGQDWAMLFDSYDKDGSGGLDVHEFTATVRQDASIPASQFSDNEVANLFNSIDVDRSGVIDVTEFENWLKNPIKRKTTAPRKARSGFHEPKLDDADKEALAELHTGVPFIAEYIATKNVAIWNYPDPERCGSNSIGTLEKGEVVAVTQVWNKYRLWIHRLGWNKSPSSGWVSSRARNGRGEVLLERLPAEEWSARGHHETAVAQRVAMLDKMQTMYTKTARARSDAGKPLKPNVMPQEWVEKHFRLAEPGKRAAQLLGEISEPERCKELLAGMLLHNERPVSNFDQFQTLSYLLWSLSMVLHSAELERQPRSEWSETLGKWECWEQDRQDIEAAEQLWRRQREDQREEYQRRRVDQNSPHPPPGAAPSYTQRPHSMPTRQVRSRAHVEKISRDAEARGFTGSYSARAPGAPIPVDASALDMQQSVPLQGAIDAALQSQARKPHTGDGAIGCSSDVSKRRQSFSGIDLALKRHSARQKIPPSEIARATAEEKIAALIAREESEPARHVQEQEQEQEQEPQLTAQQKTSAQPQPPNSAPATSTSLHPHSTRVLTQSRISTADDTVASADGGGRCESLATGRLGVAATTNGRGAAAGNGGATSTRCHDPPPRPRGRR